MPAAASCLRSARIEGETRLTASHVGADMDCSGAVLDNPGKTALEMSRTVVKGALFLRREARVNGMLTLTGASIGTIHDEASSWPKTGNLLLNRCRYGAFIDSPVDAESRLDGRARQTPERFGEDFWPQPYEQLASVFREMGHGEDARAVLVVKERLQRQARRARAGNPLWRALRRSRWRPKGSRSPMDASRCSPSSGSSCSGSWVLWYSLTPSTRAPSCRTAPSCCVRRNGRCAGWRHPNSAHSSPPSTDERARPPAGRLKPGLLRQALGGVELPGLQCLDVLARYAAAGTRDGTEGVLAAQPG